jgi:outer membrane biosynthesis protein TonB
MGRAWFAVVVVHALMAVAVWYALVEFPSRWGGEGLAPTAAEVTPSESLVWQAPSDYLRLAESAAPIEEVEKELPAEPAAAAVPPTPVPTVAEAATMSEAEVPPRESPVPKRDERPANRFIPLSRLTSDLAEPPSTLRSERPGTPVPTLLDVARVSGPTALTPRSGGSGIGGNTMRAGLDEVNAAVQEAFMRNWVAPDIRRVDPKRRTARLEVSLGRDGSILSTHLFEPSGSAPLDVSILEAAKKVKKIPVALPAGFPQPLYQLQVNFQID